MDTQIYKAKVTAAKRLKQRLKIESHQTHFNGPGRHEILGEAYDSFFKKTAPRPRKCHLQPSFYSDMGHIQFF